MKNKNLFIDTSAFMCMHCSDKTKAKQAVGFFSNKFNDTLHMSLEQVGMCDDVVWSYARDVQNAYYPFMDRLHSEMNIVRIPYTRADVEFALTDPTFEGVRLFHALVLAQVVNHQGHLYTANSFLLNDSRFNSIVSPVYENDSSTFGEVMQTFYERSSVLTVHNDVISHAY